MHPPVNRVLRVFTTFDFFEAQIIVGMLRAHGIEVRLFDENMVRLDWFRIIAFGGFRIVATGADGQRARDLLSDYELCPATAADDDLPACPACGESGIEDPLYRRFVFLSLFISSALIPAIFSPLLIRFFKWRTRCTACGFRWRAPPQHSHRELTAMVDAAELAST